MNPTLDVEVEPAYDLMHAPPPQFASLRVAIIHYWFVGRAGGEHVVEALADLFPQADLFTLVAKPEVMADSLKEHKLTTSFLQRIPFVHKFHRHTLLLQPLALEQFDLSEYDLVLSSESGPAKGVLTSPRTLHICYCHSPMRYIWDMYAQYLRAMPAITRFIFGLTAHKMRLWDYASAGRVDAFITNSKFVASRVRKFYGRNATVIHPPVQVRSVIPSPPAASLGQQDYYLAVGRLVDYKRFDLAIAACTKLGRPLKIIGTGPELKNLKRIAGPTVEFLGTVSDDQKHQAFAGCRALLFPGEEDFGIVPVEAQAHGKPVIGYGSGGLLETVIDGDSEGATGMYFHQQTVNAMEAAILRFEQHAERFDPQLIRDHAMQFDATVFSKNMTSFLTTALADHEAGVLAR